MDYIRPEEVKSPKKKWRIVDILEDNGEDDYAIAIGTWHDKKVLAIRTNGRNIPNNAPRQDKRKLAGFPLVRGKPVYYILPEATWRSILDNLVKNIDKCKLAESYLGMTVAIRAEAHPGGLSESIIGDPKNLAGSPTGK